MQVGQYSVLIKVTCPYFRGSFVATPIYAGGTVQCPD